MSQSMKTNLSRGRSSRLLFNQISSNFSSGLGAAFSCRMSSNGNASTTSDEVQSYVKNGLGVLVLNRPRVLNSLNLNMVQRICATLDSWSKPNSGVSCVLIQGSGDKAFCAGGDVKSVVLSAKAGNYDMPDTFFNTEYRMNLQISRLPIPYVAIIDGIVMGGGAGASVHGHFRIATERTVFAMPECGIGLYPDIGASFFLSKLPGHLGLYMALTGARLKGAAVRDSGLATHYIPSASLPHVEARLLELGRDKLSSFEAVARALCSSETAQGSVPNGGLQRVLPIINSHFGKSSVSEILDALKASLAQLEDKPPTDMDLPDAAVLEFLRETLQLLAKGSPLSQAVTFELMKRAKHATLEQCLQADSIIVAKFTRDQGDFIEGVSATLINRGQAPSWKYTSLQEVPSTVVESFFDGTPFSKQKQNNVEASSPVGTQHGSKL